MRVNVYAEEITQRIQIIQKKIDGRVYTGLRFYLELPVTVRDKETGEPFNVAGPFIHRPSDGEETDDDSSAVTFWGKQDMREGLRHALRLLDEYYGQQGELNLPEEETPEGRPPESGAFGPLDPFSLPDGAVLSSAEECALCKMGIQIEHTHHVIQTH